MAVQRDGNWLLGLQVPEIGVFLRLSARFRGASTGGHQQLSIGGECQIGDDPLLHVRRGLVLLVLLPEPHRVVQAGRGNEVPVAGDCHGIHHVAMSAELLDLLPRGGIP